MSLLSLLLLSPFLEKINARAQVTDFGMSRFIPEPIAAASTVTPSSSSSTTTTTAATTAAAAAAAAGGGGATSSPPPPPSSTLVDSDATAGAGAGAGAANVAAHPLVTPGIVRGRAGNSAAAVSSSSPPSSEAPDPDPEGRSVASAKGNGGGFSSGSGNSNSNERGPGLGKEGESGLRGSARWARGGVKAPGMVSGGAVGSGRGGRAGGGGAAERGSDREFVGLGLTTNLGTVAWAAPEMLLGGEGGRGEYTSKVRVALNAVVPSPLPPPPLLFLPLLLLLLLLLYRYLCEVDLGAPVSCTEYVFLRPSPQPPSFFEVVGVGIALLIVDRVSSSLSWVAASLAGVVMSLAETKVTALGRQRGRKYGRSCVLALRVW